MTFLLVSSLLGDIRTSASRLINLLRCPTSMLTAAIIFCVALAAGSLIWLHAEVGREEPKLGEGVAAAGDELSSIDVPLRTRNAG